jgi:hypothetical protein
MRVGVSDRTTTTRMHAAEASRSSAGSGGRDLERRSAMAEWARGRFPQGEVAPIERFDRDAARLEV